MERSRDATLNPEESTKYRASDSVPLDMKVFSPLIIYYYCYCHNLFYYYKLPRKRDLVVVSTLFYSNYENVFRGFLTLSFLLALVLDKIPSPSPAAPHFDKFPSLSAFAVHRYSFPVAPKNSENLFSFILRNGYV